MESYIMVELPVYITTTFSIPRFRFFPFWFYRSEVLEHKIKLYIHTYEIKMVEEILGEDNTPCKDFCIIYIGEEKKCIALGYQKVKKLIQTNKIGY